MSELLGKITRSRAPVKSFFLKCCQEFVFSEARRGNRETRVKLLQIKRKTSDGQSRARYFGAARRGRVVVACPTPCPLAAPLLEPAERVMGSLFFRCIRSACS